MVLLATTLILARGDAVGVVDAIRLGAMRVCPVLCPLCPFSLDS
jgi:hypothetical protein